MNVKIQTIEIPGGEPMVVMTRSDFEALRDAADAAEAAAVRAGIARGEIETFTEEETLAYLAAATPLAFWRRRRGLSQQALAAAAGISQSYVADLEAGRRKGDPALFLRLARALGVAMEAIVVDEERGAGE
ncbi:helix-turn-helix domain-containing protein [Oharaeibacter diazotrophicus]|uniref:Helix-turn-helix protein n=1 Tax=Oharaeibacter diazotrophicus TaxID=1920512 RepID=A0A4R6RG25_9HYPH|nr:helix-turn-helix transcriptional regulator [Oharaeibacter diazotrophicus]TDP85371.1 helix-turn-helix protein [Oharaeibacter diazotrophicus]BBE74341.1 anaerobic benzoate catabolism transcriptional regulator [Pleomorphomonas sp. SM30]GLS75966.1 hypothetical protein GCM10007904_13010 [Oharaeibacter diazotrophicus]